MTKVRLVAVDDKFFSRTKAGTIGGTIYFQIGDDQFFPEKGWTDMPLAVLRAWLEVLVQIADGTVTRDTAPFFDGDLAVEVSTGSPGYVHLDFIHKGKSKFSTPAEIRELVENALTVADFLLTNCRRRNWNNNDSEALTSLTKQGLRILSNFRRDQAMRN